MRRPRKFLAFILILLLINTLFFVAWYAFDLQGIVKGILEKEAGKALKGTFQIKDFSISDQQVFAENISFWAADGSLSFTVASARIRFNLLKFIFSGFKMRNLLNKVEVDKADVIVNIFPKPKKPPKKLEIPDLHKFFNDLTIKESSLKLDLNLPVTLGELGTLAAREQLNAIDIHVRNTRVSNITLQAESVNQGQISLSAVLDKGRLASSSINVKEYRPLYLNHPQAQNASAVLNATLEASQKEKDAKLDFYLNANLSDTEALLFTKYPLTIPELSVESNGDGLRLSLSPSSVGTSTMEGSLALTGLQKKLRFSPSQLDVQLDLGMIDPAFKGIVDASLSAEGTLTKPVVSIAAAAQNLSYQDYELSNVSVEGSFEDNELTFNLRDAVWENQTFGATGTFDPKERKLKTDITTNPINRSVAGLQVSSTATVELSLYSMPPEIKAEFATLNVSKGELDQRNISGHVNLLPSVQDGKSRYYIDLDLKAPDGTKVVLLGDLLDRELLMDASFNNLAVAEIYPLDAINIFKPIVTGNLSAFLTGDKAVLSTDFDLRLDNGFNFRSGLKVMGSYDISTLQGSLALNSHNGTMNDYPLTLDIIAGLDSSKINVRSCNMNDQIFLSGSIDLQNLGDLDFQLDARDINSELVMGYFPKLKLIDINGMDLTANYNQDQKDILLASCTLRQINIPAFKPLSGNLSFLGYPRQVEVNGGIHNDSRKIMDINGTVDLLEGLDLRINALANQLATSDFLPANLAEGTLDCNLGFYLSDLLTKEPELSLDAQFISDNISIPKVIDLDDILIRFTQTEDVMIVDTLAVQAKGIASIKGSGALDYNLLSDSYYEGDHVLDLEVEGFLFDWLKQYDNLFADASGKTDLNFRLKTSEEQFLIQSGELQITDGRLVVKEQPEPVRDIAIKARLDNNKLILDDCTCYIGDGKVTLLNEFDDDPGSHLSIGILDLGNILVKVDDPGAIINIPSYTAPRTHSNVVVRGQNSEYASIKGPFEDLNIFAELLVSNSDAVYPPNTDNLLSLIYSFRSAFTKPDYSAAEAAPLPFSFDLMIRMQDNVRYATYPTSFVVQPGGFVHLIYDGRRLRSPAANFDSDQGSIDFFGTVFQAEKLNVSIIESQNLFDIEGTFYKRAADGTIITLTVTTDADATKSIFQRLTFNLKSDNPDDRTVSNILSRLRYNAGSEELSPAQQGSLLQDEALSLISDNLNTSLVSPFLYPLENTVRRLLKLDNFSIQAGFIQNLFTEYSNDPNQIAEYTNMDQFVSNIAQFSSSILLNNLSVSLSKYLGRFFYLDYTFTLQEATDLQNKTQIMMSHDTSLRVFLPQQFRLAYTFKYEPKDTNMTHEIMLQRSFRFWGL